MAASAAVARRYAEALFAAARAGDQVDAVERDLVALQDLVRRTPRVLEVMENPLVPVSRKRAILDQVFSGRIEATSLRFLHLLVEKRRSEALPLVHDLYLEMANEHRGILPAFVTAAAALAPDEELALTDRLAAMTGKRIVLHTEVRPELIGGLRVRVGDTVIDGTVVGYLRQLRERLKQTLV